METLKITVDDKQTKEMVVRMLRTIKGVNIQQGKHAAAADTDIALKALSGIWAGREISAESLRKKAWTRGSVR